MDNEKIRSVQLSKLMQYYFGSDNPMVVGNALASMKKAGMAEELYRGVQEKRKMSDINMRAEDIEKSAEGLDLSEGVNLDEMAENPQFIRYLANNGLSAKEAYYLVNKDTLDSNNLKRAREEITASILAKKDRIAENAAISASMHKRKTKKAHELSGDEIDEIVMRVRNGERIMF